MLLYLLLCVYLLCLRSSYTPLSGVDFPGYTRWGWFIGFKTCSLCAEILQKELKCDLEEEQE